MRNEDGLTRDQAADRERKRDVKAIPTVELPLPFQLVGDGNDGALGRLREADQAGTGLVTRPARAVRGDDQIDVWIDGRTDGGQHGGSTVAGAAAANRLDSKSGGDIGHKLAVTTAADKRQGDAFAAIAFIKVGHERRPVVPESDDDGGMLRLIKDVAAILDSHAQG